MRMVVNSAAERNNVAVKFGAVESAEQTLERLAECLPTM